MSVVVKVQQPGAGPSADRLPHLQACRGRCPAACLNVCACSLRASCSASLLTPLPCFPSCHRRPPTVVVGSITPTSAVATVTPPTKFRPWASYVLTLCVKGSQSCNTTTCAAVPSANKPTNCSLTDLSMGTSYTLTASAQRSDGMQSPDSQPVQFTTPVYP